jgi:RHS repeat-associated protein
MAAYAGANPATADWRFNLKDHLGSPRQMLGQDKSAKARFDFSPYGELMRSSGLPLTIGYTGHRWDPAIGQYFAPFRYYNPQTARWNTRDPLGYIDGPNVYAYVAGNPVSYTDPSGGWLTPDTIWDLANLAYDICKGDWTSAALDGLAALIPGVPGGVGKISKFRPRIFHFPTRKKALDAARRAGHAAPVPNMPHKPGELPHYHPTDRNGKRYPRNSPKDGHYTYPKPRITTTTPKLPRYLPTFGGTCNYGM